MSRPTPPAREIETVTLFGKRRSFPASAFRIRVSVYGVAVRDGRVLLGRSAFTGKWDIPGGGAEPWETLAEALAREFAEETGVVPEVGDLLHFSEGFFSVFDHPFHSLRFYFRVQVPVGAALVPQAAEVRELAWVDALAADPSEFAPGDLDVVRKALGGGPPPPVRAGSAGG
jgi:8-oxo-dGTP diphosphatase